MPNKNGLHLVNPTSIAKTGASSTASANSKGFITFTNCESLSLNGIFSADYDNYLLVCEYITSSTLGPDVFFRYRASGTDNATANSYTYQYTYANGNSLSGGRASSDSVPLFWTRGEREGGACNFFGPYLSQPTASRTFGVESYADSTIGDLAHTHNQSTSYDGLTMFLISGYTFSGSLGIYGLRK